MNIQVAPRQSLDSPPLPQQGKGSDCVVRIYQRSPAESQSVNPPTMNFEAGVNPGPSWGPVCHI